MNPKRNPSGRFWRWLLLFASVLSALAGVLSLFLYYSLYWQYRDLFNEKGRYFDPSAMVVYDESAFVCIIPALALLGLAVMLGWAWWKVH